MRGTTTRRSSGPSQVSCRPANLSRRQLLAGAGVGAAALFLEQSGLQAPGAADFDGCLLAYNRGHRRCCSSTTWRSRLRATGSRRSAPPTQILKRYPRAQVYDGRGKALFPGLINCHAHLAATIARGFNEDFGFPNSARLAIQPTSLLSNEEATLMVTVGALECIRTGTTTIVENASASAAPPARWRRQACAACSRSPSAIARMLPARCPRQGLARSEAPRFSPRLRDEGLQRINDLFSDLARRQAGTHQRVSRRRRSPKTSSPELLQAVRAFAEKHDLGYTIHLNQSRPEVEFMRRYHGVRPAAFLDKHGFLGPRLFAAHCRYVDDSEIALLGRSAHDHFASGRTWPRTEASSRPSRPCARRAARSRTAPTTTPTTCSRSCGSRW